MMHTPITLDGKTVIVRADVESGLTPAFGAEIAALAKQGARVAIVAGYGNPGGDFNPAWSLRRFVAPLEAVSGMPVLFIPECVGSGAEAGLARAPFGAIALLENLRFHPHARRQSRSFAMRLSVLGDFFSIPGGMPEPAAQWIRELATLLPAPETTPAAPA